MFAIAIAWFTEAIWKSWQTAFGKRIMNIERHFAGCKTVEIPFQMLSGFIDVNGGKFSWCRAVSMLGAPFVFTPYLPLILVFAYKDRSNLVAIFNSISSWVMQ